MSATITRTAKITPKHAAFDFRKYRPFAFAPLLSDRTWPSKTIEKAPVSICVMVTKP